MANKKRLWYYVSHYAEYPIFEAAEGGYYYAGNELIEYFRFGNLKNARKFLRRLACEREFNIINDNAAFKKSKYIGEGEEIVIETSLGKRECGFKPYQ